MTDDPIPTDVRRFLQTSAVSVPHIELILLLRREPAMAWSARDVAQRLYIGEERAETLLRELQSAGIVEPSEARPPSYYYRPATPELGSLLDRLDATYAKHLAAVTKLVHAARDASAEAFARAFRFRKDT
jgi:DNA-binding IclR family transcriptional regulator